jgi:hypothetical protein
MEKLFLFFWGKPNDDYEFSSMNLDPCPVLERECLEWWNGILVSGYDVPLEGNSYACIIMLAIDCFFPEND